MERDRGSRPSASARIVCPARGAECKSGSLVTGEDGCYDAVDSTNQRSPPLKGVITWKEPYFIGAPPPGPQAQHSEDNLRRASGGR